MTTTATAPLAPRHRLRPSRLLDPVEATGRRWALHAAIVAVLLGVLLAVVGTHQVVDADEGAALVQAKVVQQTGQWAMFNDPKLDPTGDWFPVHISNPVGDHWYPFTRPPIYPATIRPLLDLGGLPLVLAAHLAALLVAALGVGRLVESIRRGRGIQAMWLTALLSPLLFDGYWVIAHTIAAAGATWATWAAARFVLDRRRSALPVWLVGLAVAVLFRNEAVIFCGGLAVALPFCAPPARRRVASALAVGTLAVGAISYWSMHAYQRAVESGSATPAYRPGFQGGFLAGRLRGFEHTMLSPGVAGGVAGALVVVAAVLTVTAVLSLRFGVLSDGVVRLAAMGGAVAAIGRLAFPADLVTGLLMAAPCVVAAAIAVPVDLLRRDLRVRLMAICSVVTVAVVAGTQNQFGGGGEWGGRYFHVVLPLICGLAVVSLDQLVTRRGALGRLAVGCGLCVALALSVLSISESRAARQVADVLTETTWQAARTTRSAHDPGGPVVVSTWVAGGRFAWSHLLDGRYLTVDEPKDFPELGRRLAAAGVPDFTMLAEPGDQTRIGDVGSGYRVVRQIRLGTHGWTVAVLRRG